MTIPTRHPGQKVVDPAKPEKHLGQEIVDRLVTLAEQLEPFLDNSGRVYYFMPHVEKERRAISPLRSRQVRALLAYRYHREHDQHPGKGRINEAIEYVEGKLLENRRGPVVQEAACPVLRCFLRVTQDEVSGCGSASEILKLLREIQKNHRLLKGAEMLPENATEMGIWLENNQLVLQAHGVEVYRPTRQSAKRLWGWRRIIPDDDTCDTSSGEVSLKASLLNSKEDNEKRPNDTVTNEQIAELLPKEALS